MRLASWLITFLSSAIVLGGFFQAAAALRLHWYWGLPAAALTMTWGFVTAKLDGVLKEIWRGTEDPKV